MKKATLSLVEKDNENIEMVVSKATTVLVFISNVSLLILYKWLVNRGVFSLFVNF